jgi:ribonuclease E
MADKMLIDASHEEETRVVVVRGNRIEEFDFESQHKKQLRGNIYLAKVTRVEPSLQAAFVDYGGNRHGFLAFSEIHPDYYQIPLADRQALLAAEAEAEAERARHEEDDDDEAADAADAVTEEADGDGEEPSGGKRGKGKSRRGRGRGARKTSASSEDAADDADDASPDKAAAERDAEGDDSPQVDGEDNGDDDSGPREMAAIVEMDTISEPVDEHGRDTVIGDDVDPGVVDLEAAKHVEGQVAATREDAAQETDGDAASDADEADDGATRSRGEGRRGKRARGRRGNDDGGDEAGDENGGKVESVGAEDALEEVPDRTVRKPRKQYRIQEVIKRRQILLVQVVKEERGNKGAALTTYLSLAGRYSVLMPNTARGGGISRKITNVQDRKRLKEVAKGLEVPQGMGVILRTAGANRTKAEVKRDFEYLMRLWENVRSLTLASTAPCLVYEEGSLIKRSIRDLYNKDIGEIVVSGEAGYREAKDFMKMLMPSHAKVVQPYREIHPIFSRSGIEAQLDRMLQPQVTLKSGGYIIINQTEALVAIDVNSGRSTKEHSIEDTALQTNLEAADEVARQLRLRDLAGLIVVDFIDMEEKRNNRAVEKRLKDALKNDRARIQVGRISHFGLLEMSRQRIRASVLESTTQVCEHCGGTGHVRSQSSVALHVIRSIEEFLLKSTTHDIVVRTMPDTAIYVLNHKRATIVEMERRFGVSIMVEADASVGSVHLAIDRGAPVETPVRIEDILPAETRYQDEPEDEAVASWDEEETEDAPAESAPPARGEETQDGSDERRRKRRRRRRGGRDRNGDNEAAGEREGVAQDEDGSEADAGDESHAEHADENDADWDRPKKRRRRGKRGGRRNRGDEAVASENAGESGEDSGTDAHDEAASDTVEIAAAAADLDDEEVASDAIEPVEAAPETAPEDAAAASEVESAPAAEAPEQSPEPEEKPKRRRAPRRKKADIEAEAAAAAAATPDIVAEEGDDATVPQEPDATETPVDESPEPAETPAPEARTEPVVSSTASDTKQEAADKPKKVGWWQRRGFL